MSTENCLHRDWEEDEQPHWQWNATGVQKPTGGEHVSGKSF